MMRGKIILLNGVSSSGKSTLAAALAERLPDYFVLGFDDIVSLIRTMRNNKREPSTDSIMHQNYSVHYSTFILHRLVKAISQYSFNIIVDTVLDMEEDYIDFMEQFKDEDVLYVGVHCPLFELERRERERNDRKADIAREQLKFVHKNMTYHVEVDTYKSSIDQCASDIVNALHGSDGIPSS